MAAAVPGQVKFMLKSGEEKVTSMAALSQRSRAEVAEALGLGAVAVSAVPAMTEPAPPAGVAATTSNVVPAAAPSTMQLTVGDVLPADPAAVDATDEARLRSLEGTQATVVGTVSEVPTLGSSGHRLILFEGSEFNVFIGKTQLDASADWVLDDLPGKRLQASGKIEMYREKPQIRGLQPSQLRRVQ